MDYSSVGLENILSLWQFLAMQSQQLLPSLPFFFYFLLFTFSHFLLYFQGWPTLIVGDLVYSVQSDLGRPGCHSIILSSLCSDLMSCLTIYNLMLRHLFRLHVVRWSERNGKEKAAKHFGTKKTSWFLLWNLSNLFSFHFYLESSSSFVSTFHIL